MEALIKFDFSLFFAINRGMSNAFLDAVLPWCRTPLFWAPLYLFIFSYAALQFEKKKYWIFLLGLILTVGISDITSSKLIKKTVQRYRPCNSILVKDYVQLRVDRCGSGYSFTSSHAANHFAAARFVFAFFAPLFGRWVAPALLTWAGVVAFAQVYVGLHFPADVFFGAILGLLIATFVLKILQIKTISAAIEH